MNYIDRFFNLTYPEPNTGCWLWGGSYDKYGYGCLTVRSLPTTLWRTHRLSYQIYNGVFDYSLNVLHKCDNPACVNPDHLWLGTHKQNMDDREKKQRNKGGDRWVDKLTPIKIKEIRSLPEDTDRKLIAKTYNITLATVCDVINKKTWRWI